MKENEEKYVDAFLASFDVDSLRLPDLEYQGIPEWDSVGHMGLIAHLEEAFDIQIEMDDVIELGSFKKGKAILSKYGIQF